MELNASFYAARFRELAGQFEQQRAATPVGAAFEEFNLRTAAGERVIAAVGRGFLRDVDGLAELVALYAAPPERDPDAAVSWSWIPANLFLDVAGQVLLNGTFADGKFTVVDGSLVGVIPAATGEAFAPTHLAASFRAPDPAARDDFARLARGEQAFRYATACRVLAETLEKEGQLPVDSKAKSKQADAACFESIGGDHVRAFLAAARSSRSCDDRMRDIFAIDERVIAYNSNKWAEILGVTPSAVRQCPWWKEDRARVIAENKGNYKEE